MLSPGSAPDALLLQQKANDASAKDEVHEVDELKKAKHEQLLLQCKCKLWEKRADLILSQSCCFMRGCFWYTYRCFRVLFSLMLIGGSIALFVNSKTGNTSEPPSDGKIYDCEFIEFYDGSGYEWGWCYRHYDDSGWLVESQCTEDANGQGWYYEGEEEGGEEEEQTATDKIVAGLLMLALGIVNAAWKWIKKKICCCCKEMSIDEQAEKMAHDIEVKHGITIPNVAAQHDIELIEADDEQCYEEELEEGDVDFHAMMNA